MPKACYHAIEFAIALLYKDNIMAKVNQCSVFFSKSDDNVITAELHQPSSYKGVLSSTGKTMVVAYDTETFGDVRVSVTVTRKATDSDRLEQAERIRKQQEQDA